MRKAHFLVVILIFAFSGCATNPVTGKKELRTVSSSQMNAMGAQQYAPARQMQGGDYTIDPELTAYVQQVGNKVAGVSDNSLPYEFSVLNNSVPNAWAMPGGKIAINRGLLTELNSEAELAAVLGHEVVHAAAEHGASAASRGMLMQVGMLALQISQIDNNYGQYVVGGAQLGAQLISTKYGRDDELESDYYGMKYMSEAGYDPTAAVDLQKTFVRLSKSSGRRNDWLSGLFASHPPSQERVATNKRTAQELPPGGDYGRERYQQKIAGLKRAQPAYKAYDDGVKALSEGNAPQAATLAQRAINLEPREGKFYGLLGDSYLQKREYQNAIQYYNQALEKNSNFFQTYLTRGIATFELGDLATAENDFQQSIRMLPTATAYHRLGLIALKSNRQQEAVKYLEQAATSNSDVGRAAGATLARLQLESQPERYIGTAIGVDNNGYLIIQLTNAAPVAVNNVQLAIVVYDESGRAIRNEPIIIREVIQANQKRNLSTRLGPITSREQLQRIKIAVQGARIAE